jgi:hypothetical protein
VRYSHLFALLFTFILGSCSSTPKFNSADTLSVKKVGIVVLGANSIQTGKYSYKFPQPYYGRAIERILKEEFHRLGYETLIINPIAWQKQDRQKQIQYFGSRYLITHFFIVSPQSKDQGFALNSFAKKTANTVNFDAELFDGSARKLSVTHFNDLRYLDVPPASRVKASFDRNPSVIKAASLDYYQKQLPRFASLVMDSGLVAKDFVRDSSRMPASVGDSSRKKSKRAKDSY